MAVRAGSPTRTTERASENIGWKHKEKCPFQTCFHGFDDTEGGQLDFVTSQLHPRVRSKKGGWNKTTKRENYTTWQDHTSPSTPQSPSPSSRRPPSCLPYPSKPKREFKPSRLEIQHNKVPSTDVEAGQMLYGILRIVDVFIHNKGRSSRFLRFTAT